MKNGSTIRLFLCGDVMTGRGIDQVMAHHCAPTLHEPFVHDARRYVALAEAASGAIPRPVDDAYPWGVALGELALMEPDARIVNLETSVTTSGDAWPDKGINYRMHPGNVGCLGAAAIDCCALANNHVLDWGYAGLDETLASLRAAGIRTAGAGRDAREAATPAVLERGARIRVHAWGMTSSGVPRAWAAGAEKPGVSLLPDDPSAALRVARSEIEAARDGADDVIVASIHWGDNWGYAVPPEQVALAHGLVEEAGVHVVHGHSSHHAKGVEVYRGQPILYGCGDLLTDYEGIGGYESYRGDLALLYFVDLDPVTRRLATLTMTPVRLRRFRLERAAPDETAWIAKTLKRECARFGASVRARDDGRLALAWAIEEPR